MNAVVTCGSTRAVAGHLVRRDSHFVHTQVSFAQYSPTATDGSAFTRGAATSGGSRLTFTDVTLPGAYHLFSSADRPILIVLSQ